MSFKKQTALTPLRAGRDPFAMLRRMAGELDQVFDEPLFAWRFPFMQTPILPSEVNWSPAIEVFELDNRLVTKVDLPGLKKNDIKVEVIDGYLAISGERKSEIEETKYDVYRCERSYGGFYRAVPLPEGVKLTDVKATFADGVLEVSVPLPVEPNQKAYTVEIEERTKAAKHAA